MATVKLKLDWQDPSWVIGNTDIIDDKTIIHLTDGRYARADGITQVQNLTWFGSQSSTTSSVVSGCVLSVGTYGGSGSDNDIRVTAGSYYISGQGSYSAIQTQFLDNALAAAGLQRLVGLYGTTSGTITKVEGTEGAVLTLPTQPANTVIIGFVIVTDGAVATSPSSPTIDPIPVDGSSNAVSSNGVSDALATKQAALGYTAENSANKGASGGYVGLTLFKINFRNAANTFISFFTNSNTAARTYTFQDRDGTIADDTDLATKMNVYFGGHAATSYADSTTYYFGLADALGASTAADTTRKIRFMKDGTIKSITMTTHTVIAATTETTPLYLRNVTDGTETLIGNFQLNGTTGVFNITQFTGLALSVVTTKDYCFKVVAPVYATNPNSVTMLLNLLVL